MQVPWNVSSHPNGSGEVRGMGVELAVGSHVSLALSSFSSTISEGMIQSNTLTEWMVTLKISVMSVSGDN